MAEWPMANVVQQCGGQQQLSVLLRNSGGESLVARQMIQVLDRREKHAQRMFLPRMGGGWINQANQTQLTNLCEPAEAGGVNQPPYPIRERHVHAWWNSHPSDSAATATNFRNVVD